MLADLEAAARTRPRRVEGAASGARRRAARRRRSARRQLPISGYDELNVGQVRARLAGLTPAELRKVRDHERRNANRKTVLAAIESKLG